MSLTIEVDTRERGRRKDLSLFAGESMTFTGSPEARLVVTLGQDAAAAPLIEATGPEGVQLSAADLTALPEGVTCLYNVWIDAETDPVLVLHGSLILRRSLAPIETTPDSSTPIPLEIDGTPSTSVTIGEAYSFTPDVSGGTAPHAFALLSGTLPSGWTFDAATGTVAGQASQAGIVADLQIEVTDALGATALLAAFSIVVTDDSITVAFSSMGQSNADGTNSLADVPTDAQGVYERVQLADARFLNQPSVYPAWYPLTVVRSGEVVDDVTGPVREATGGGGGVSSIFGLAQAVPETSDGGGLFGGAVDVRVIKKAQGGVAQTGFEPGGVQWNGYDAMMTDIAGPLLEDTQVRWSHVEYAQGEREAQLAVSDAEAATGETGWEDVVLVALTDDRIIEWGRVQAENRRAARAQLGLPDLPYVFKGFVLPGDGIYQDSQQRVREAVAQQQKNLSRWMVRLSPAGDTIELTDLAGEAQSVSWDLIADAPVMSAAGEATQRDDNTYYVDARGYETGDGLHHDVSAQMLIGRAVELLLRQLYGAGGLPPAANHVSELLPYFIEEPAPTQTTETSVTLAFTASQAGLCHLAAYPVGQVPASAADIVDGVGAVVTGSTAAVKRGERSLTLSGLSPATDYAIAAVLSETGAATSMVSQLPVLRTADAATGSGFDMAEIPGLVSWLHARGAPAGPVTDSATLVDHAGATASAFNVDGGTELCEFTTDIGSTPTVLVRGGGGNAAGTGRQRIVVDHGDLGNRFAMAALISRADPAVGQYVAVGCASGAGGIRSAFYYSDKSAAGGYGTGAQWGLSPTAPLAAGDTEIHLMVIVSDGTAAGDAADPTTRVYVDGVAAPEVVSDPDAVPSWQSSTVLGQGASSINSNYDIRFTDFLIIAGALDDVDRQRLEGALVWNANRPDLLPDGHPFKSAAP